MRDLAELTTAIETGDRGTAVRITGEAIAAGNDPLGILDAMTTAMRVIGRRFQDHEIYVPEMLISARAMKEATALLEPTLSRAGILPMATAVIGTVRGDLHDIGKNLVAMMWRGANIRVVDLGTNVSPQEFAARAREHNARLVGASALLTTTMVEMRAVVDSVRSAGPHDAKVIVGGAPVTADFAKEIGADAYAENAGAAAEVALCALGA